MVVFVCVGQGAEDGRSACQGPFQQTPFGEVICFLCLFLLDTVKTKRELAGLFIYSIAQSADNHQSLLVVYNILDANRYNLNV